MSQVLVHGGAGRLRAADGQSGGGAAEGCGPRRQRAPGGYGNHWALVTQARTVKHAQGARTYFEHWNTTG